MVLYEIIIVKLNILKIVTYWKQFATVAAYAAWSLFLEVKYVEPSYWYHECWLRGETSLDHSKKLIFFITKKVSTTIQKYVVYVSKRNSN